MSLQRLEIVEKLLHNWSYNEKQVETVVDDLLAMNDALLSAFDSWFQTGELPNEPEYEGFNPKNLSKTYPLLKPPAVFLLLNWIRTEPIVALQSLQEEFGRSEPMTDR